jgi:hypothetical protein
MGLPLPKFKYKPRKKWLAVYRITRKILQPQNFLITSVKMSIRPVKQIYRTTAMGRVVIVLSTTKYTYQHFSEFHQTVITILNGNDLSELSRIQLDNTRHFINLILGLLDVPIHPDYDLHSGQSIAEQPDYAGAEYTISKAAITDLDSVPSAKALELLLNWIDRIVLLKRITLESLLDQFYSLGIVKLNL